MEEAFRIEDASGFALAYVYFADDPQGQSVVGRMSRGEARRIAIGMAALPDLRAALREKDG